MTAIGEERFSSLIKGSLIISRKGTREWLEKNFENNYGFLEIFEKELGDRSIWTFYFSKNVFVVKSIFLFGFSLNFREYKEREGWRYGKVNIYNIKELEKIPKDIWGEMDKHLKKINNIFF